MNVDCKKFLQVITADVCAREQGVTECRGCRAPTRHCTSCGGPGGTADPDLGLCAHCLAKPASQNTGNRRLEAPSVSAQELPPLPAHIVQTILGLPPNESKVLQFRLGIATGKPMTIAQTARHAWMSPRSVSYQQFEAIRHLRTKLDAAVDDLLAVPALAAFIESIGGPKKVFDHVQFPSGNGTHGTDGADKPLDAAAMLDILVDRAQQLTDGRVVVKDPVHALNLRGGLNTSRSREILSALAAEGSVVLNEDMSEARLPALETSPTPTANATDETEDEPDPEEREEAEDATDPPGRASLADDLEDDDENDEDDEEEDDGEDDGESVVVTSPALPIAPPVKVSRPAPIERPELPQNLDGGVRRKAEAAIETLPQLLRDVLKMRLGIGQKKPMSMDRVAQHYDSVPAVIRRNQDQAVELLAERLDPESLAWLKAKFGGSSYVRLVSVPDASEASRAPELNETMLEAINTLDPLQKRILHARLGIGFYEPRSLAQAAREFSCSRNQLYLFQQKAFAELRKKLDEESFETLRKMLDGRGRYQRREMASVADVPASSIRVEPSKAPTPPPARAAPIDRVLPPLSRPAPRPAPPMAQPSRPNAIVVPASPPRAPAVPVRVLPVPVPQPASPLAHAPKAAPEEPRVERPNLRKPLVTASKAKRPAPKRKLLGRRNVPAGRALAIHPNKLLEIVASFYGVSKSELVGRCREERFVIPRQVAMFFLHEEVGLTFPGIAQLIGKRDHTTVLHGRDAVAGRMKRDALFRRQLECVRTLLKSEAAAPAKERDASRDSDALSARIERLEKRFATASAAPLMAAIADDASGSWSTIADMAKRLGSTERAFATWVAKNQKRIRVRLLRDRSGLSCAFYSIQDISERFVTSALGNERRTAKKLPRRVAR